MIIETVKQFHNKHFTSSYNFNKDCTTPEQVRNESGVPFLMFDVDMPVDIILQEIEQAKKNLGNGPKKVDFTCLRHLGAVLVPSWGHLANRREPPKR